MKILNRKQRRQAQKQQKRESQPPRNQANLLNQQRANNYALLYSLQDQVADIAYKIVHLKHLLASTQDEALIKETKEGISILEDRLNTKTSQSLEIIQKFAPTTQKPNPEQQTQEPPKE